MIVWRPPTVKLLPPSIVHVCAAPMVTGTLNATVSWAVMPPPVTVNSPLLTPLNTYPVAPAAIVTPCAMTVPLRLMLPPAVLKVAAVSLFSQAYVANVSSFGPPPTSCCRRCSTSPSPLPT